MAVFVLLAVCSGCQSRQPLLDETESFPNMAWNRFHKVVFQVDVQQPERYYDILLRVSFMDGFPYSEIPVNSVLKAPDGQVNVMRKVLGARNEDSSYAGTVFGDVWTVEKTLHSHRKFGKTGTHILEVEQLTQYYDLDGIVSVGCVIVPSKEQ